MIRARLAGATGGADPHWLTTGLTRYNSPRGEANSSATSLSAADVLVKPCFVLSGSRTLEGVIVITLEGALFKPPDDSAHVALRDLNAVGSDLGRVNSPRLG